MAVPHRHFKVTPGLRREWSLLGLRDLPPLVKAPAVYLAPVKVTKEERRVAKTVNFGVIYGMGAKALQQVRSQGCAVVVG